MNNPGPEQKAWLQIHFCVLLWGITAILGKLISLPALALVIWRMAIVSVALFLLPKVWRGLLTLPPRLVLAYCGIGILVGLHWLTFYGAIKLANASVAVTCIATVPVFLAFIEPVITGSRFRRREVLLGILVLPGIMLVVGSTPEAMNIGILMGVLAALFDALFTALNKRLVFRADPLSVTALEMVSGLGFLVLLASFLALTEVRLLADMFGNGWAEVFVVPQGTDIALLLVLAFVCTLLPFALSLLALRYLSAYATALAVNMEPIYAIILAIVILNEQQELNTGFYLGAALIMLLVFCYPLLQKTTQTRSLETSP